MGVVVDVVGAVAVVAAAFGAVAELHAGVVLIGDAADGALMQISPPFPQLLLGLFEVDGLGGGPPFGLGEEILEVRPEEDEVVQNRHHRQQRGDAGRHRQHGDHHGEAADPHMWTSLKNARIIARNMAEALADLDSAEAATVNRRLATLEQRLDSIDKATANRLEGASRSFAIWHPSLSYYARDYGLNQIAVGQESKEMPAGQVRQVIDNARNANVKVFFFQKEYDNRQAESINSAIGSRMITIDPLAYDWLGQIELITNEIARP